VRAFVLALQFLTVVTLQPDLLAGPEEMRRSRAWYAPVGALLGLMLAGAAWGLAHWLPPLALAALLTVLWGALTRFLHLDGLADSADALVHITTRERALEIMKDSRVGTFGVCAVTGLMLVKFATLASLASLEPARLGPALVFVPALARSLAALMGVLLPPARADGLGAAVAGLSGPAAELASALAALALAGLLAGRAGLVAAMAVFAVGLVLARCYARRLGGFTGDGLGAAIELAEAAALLTLTAA
jgi:adenosylcobinamide-GDP ribazoletransferase